MVSLCSPKKIRHLGIKIDWGEKYYLQCIGANGKAFTLQVYNCLNFPRLLGFLKITCDLMSGRSCGRSRNLGHGFYIENWLKSLFFEKNIPWFHKGSLYWGACIVEFRVYTCKSCTIQKVVRKKFLGLQDFCICILQIMKSSSCKNCTKQFWWISFTE